MTEKLDRSWGGRLQRRWPALYASRHVAKAVGGLLLPLLGIGALLALLVPKVSLPAIDLPEIDLPDLPLPSISIDLPDRLRTVLKVAKYAVPIAIATLVAIEELQRQRRKKETEDGAG